MSRRTEQISSTIQRAVQQVLARGLADPRYGGLVTVTGVRISEDLKKADVFISILPEEKQDLTMHAIRHAANHIRRQTGELVALRQMPQLVFRLDRSLKKQAEVLEALAKAREEAGGDLGPPLMPESGGRDAATTEGPGNNAPAAGGEGSSPQEPGGREASS